MAKNKKKTEKLESWVPDLEKIDLTALGKLPDEALQKERKALKNKLDRPVSTIAGSEGS